MNFKKNDTLIKPAQLLDSMVFSKKLDWSVRLVSNFKQQQLRLRNADNKLIFKPNNPFGVGFGIANQKMVIDILFNIKGGEENPTKKFAAEGAIILNKNLFGFVLENVHGYQVSSHQNEEEVFREDMSAFSLGLDYIRILSKNDITVRGMKAGLSNQEKSFVSYGVGGFLVLHGFKADGSIVPQADQPFFNEQAEIYKMSAYGGGVLAGFSSYFALPANFFATLYVAPGIGLEYKYVKAETESYVPSNPIIYKTDLFASLGYNRKKFYIHFTFGTDLYLTSLDFDNDLFFSVTKSKFIIGYNVGNPFRSKKPNPK